jgi:membrane protein implicated in regulation of membrane protease activity
MGLPAENGIPYLLFAALALALLVGVRSRMKLHLVGDSVQGSADEDFVGKEVSITSGFDESSPGRGRVSYRGADWNARSEQAGFSSGAIIKITSRDGNTLIVNQETN